MARLADSAWVMKSGAASCVWPRRCFDRLAGDWIAQGRVVAHAFQSQATDGLDLILGLDFEVTESKRVLEPGQIKVNVQSDPELIHRDPGTV
jgi:hypothetical protein